MSKYDNLDARTEVEQNICSDLKSALEKRGWSVQHNGTPDNHAPGGMPDIILSKDNFVITVEPTKTKSSAQDREFQSIRDHLNVTKSENSRKLCFCIFVSPITSNRTLESIRDHNQRRVDENKSDMRILPMAFDTLELWTTHLRESESDLYPIEDLLKLFEFHNDFIDDLRVRKLLSQLVFPNDIELTTSIKQEEIEHDEKILESLIKDLARVEDYMRQNGIATSQNAIDNLIYLVFLKLYEEKRERDQSGSNRLRSAATFENYRQDAVDEQTRFEKRAIHHLFDSVKNGQEFMYSQMFTQNDYLVDSLTDDFIFDKIIPIFSRYNFIGTKVDALGAVYEVLALRADKDVKVGQFFTPENIVKFMVKLANLDLNDRVLDPACGTGRFLIHSMDDMVGKVARSNLRNKSSKCQDIRIHQCFGADIDTRIAKIAKMNMWIHGDGKSNIFGGREYNGLLLHKKEFNGFETFDNSFDIVLTNPPLGDLNYQVIPFVDSENNLDTPESDLRRIINTINRMPVLPIRNLTEEKASILRERIYQHRAALSELEDQDEIIKAKRKREVIKRNVEELTQVNAQILTKNFEYEITGNSMKGGALFLSAIWHYLKNKRDVDAPPEWRGGKMLIVLDEGILNTDNYKSVRNFLRSHFYIKAIISLTRDTFVPISKTTTKTSIIYAIKKTDLDAIQREPIFFAHVNEVGFDTKGKVINNDLDTIFNDYSKFDRRIHKSYKGLEFSKELFVQLVNS